MSWLSKCAVLYDDSGAGNLGWNLIILHAQRSQQRSGFRRQLQNHLWWWLSFWEQGGLWIAHLDEWMFAQELQNISGFVERKVSFPLRSSIDTFALKSLSRKLRFFKNKQKIKDFLTSLTGLWQVRNEWKNSC